MDTDERQDETITGRMQHRLPRRLRPAPVPDSEQTPIDRAIDVLRDSAEALQAAVSDAAEAARQRQLAILKFSAAIRAVNAEAQRVVNKARIDNSRIDRELTQVHLNGHHGSGS